MSSCSSSEIQRQNTGLAFDEDDSHLPPRKISNSSQNLAVKRGDIIVESEDLDQNEPPKSTQRIYEQSIPHPSLDSDEQQSNRTALIGQRIEHLISAGGRPGSGNSRRSSGPFLVVQRFSGKENRLQVAEKNKLLHRDDQQPQATFGPEDPTTRKLVTPTSSSSSSSSDSSWSDKVSMRKEREKRHSIRHDVHVSLSKKKRSMLTSRSLQFGIMVWNYGIGILCLISSFDYGLGAAFQHQLKDSAVEMFEVRTNLYNLIFIIDLVVVFSLAFSKRWQKDNLSQQNMKYRICFGLVLVFEILLTEFCLELITVFPFVTIFTGIIDDKKVHHLYLIKLIRLFWGFWILNCKGLIQHMKDKQIRRIKAAKTTKTKFVKVSDIVLFATILKTFRLIIIIVALSYASGICWSVLSQLNQQEETFVGAYESDSSMRDALLVTYFSFTTLSTVGLGDLHPKNSLERLTCSFIMLFGVMVTSFLIESFNRLLDQLKNFDKTYSDNQQLTLFIGTIRKFNKGELLSDLEPALEKYFKFRWKRNRNLAVSTEADNELLDQLPKKLILQLYVDYLFKDFMEQFKAIMDVKARIAIRRMLTFIESHAQSSEKHMLSSMVMQTGRTQLYEEFLVKFLRRLEPLQIREGEEIQKIDERVSSIVFVANAELEVNFNFRKFLFHLSKSTIHSEQKSFALEHLGDLGKPSGSLTHGYHIQSAFAVGLFECMFDSNSQFRYKLKKVRPKEGKASEQRLLNCFFMRQTNWKRVQNMFFTGEKPPEQFREFETHALLQYLEKVYLPLHDRQQVLLETEMNRKKLREENRGNLVAQTMINIFKKKSTGFSAESVHQRIESKEHLLKMITSHQLSTQHNPQKHIYLMQVAVNKKKENPQDVDFQSQVIYNEAKQTMMTFFFSRILQKADTIIDYLSEEIQVKQSKEDQLQAALKKIQDKDKEILRLKTDMAVYRSLMAKKLKKEKAQNGALVKVREALVEENVRLHADNKQMMEELQTLKADGFAHKKRLPAQSNIQLVDAQLQALGLRDTIKELKGLSQIKTFQEKQGLQGTRKSSNFSQMDSSPMQSKGKRGGFKNYRFGAQPTLSQLESSEDGAFKGLNFSKTLNSTVKPKEPSEHKEEPVPLDDIPTFKVDTSGQDLLPQIRNTVVLPPLSPREERKEPPVDQISFVSPNSPTDMMRRNSTFIPEHIIAEESSIGRKFSIYSQAIDQRVMEKKMSKVQPSIEEQSHITEELSHFDRMQTHMHGDYEGTSEFKLIDEAMSIIEEDIQIDSEEDSSRTGRQKSGFQANQYSLKSETSEDEDEMVDETPKDLSYQGTLMSGPPIEESSSLDVRMKNS